MVVPISNECVSVLLDNLSLVLAYLAPCDRGPSMSVL